MHNLFALNVELESRIDPSHPMREDAQRLANMTVLFIDEVSMLDDCAWAAIKDQLSSTGALLLDGHDASRHPDRDDFGRVHIVLCGDFQQLPPATSRPPFIASDQAVLDCFRFRVLRENRRLVPSARPHGARDIEMFHSVLGDIASGAATDAVRAFLVQAYVRGANVTQRNVPFEGSTACFTKRKYRNAWNKKVLARSAFQHGRSLKVKAVFCARGTQNQWIRDSAAAAIKRTVRSQNLINLRLAGQWFEDPPVEDASVPHYMRAMLVANIDVSNRFANGQTGRVVHWSPDIGTGGRKPVPASSPDVQARFFHEASLQSGKTHFLPEVDFLDVTARREVVSGARGKPSMVQLPLQPAYGLTIHKVQALTIKHKVDGCLEGVFAHGQIYVLASRVTDPVNFQTVGLPPLDLLDDVAMGWEEAGFDVDACFEHAASVTQDFEYRHSQPGADPCRYVASRLTHSFQEERRVPVRLRPLHEVLNAQPETAAVLAGLLRWMDRVDRASQTAQERPRPLLEDGAPLFPDGEWWLTDMERRQKPAEDNPMVDAEDGPILSDDDDDDAKLHEALSDTDISWSSSGSDSDDSLPCGPEPKRTRLTHVPATTQAPPTKHLLQLPESGSALTHLHNVAVGHPTFPPNAPDVADSAARSTTSPSPTLWRVQEWTAPAAPAGAPLRQSLGQFAVAPTWYNDRRCGVVTHMGTQIGATCGLFAANHALAIAALMRNAPIPVLTRSTFEARARTIAVGDALAQLVQPGGSNYDFAVLQANLGDYGVRCFLMTPADLQGGEGAASLLGGGRLEHPFRPHVVPQEGHFDAVGYLLRLPSHGGHWVTVVRLHLAAGDIAVDTIDAVALLCDSIHPHPFLLQASELDQLLLACAFDAVSGMDVHYLDFQPQWCCFLLGVLS